MGKSLHPQSLALLPVTAQTACLARFVCRVSRREPNYSKATPDMQIFFAVLPIQRIENEISTLLDLEAPITQVKLDRMTGGITSFIA